MVCAEPFLCVFTAIIFIELSCKKIKDLLKYIRWTCKGL